MLARGFSLGARSSVFGRVGDVFAVSSFEGDGEGGAGRRRGFLNAASAARGSRDREAVSSRRDRPACTSSLPQSKSSDTRGGCESLSLASFGSIVRARARPL